MCNFCKISGIQNPRLYWIPLHGAINHKTNIGIGFRMIWRIILISEIVQSLKCYLKDKPFRDNLCCKQAFSHQGRRRLPKSPPCPFLRNRLLLSPDLLQAVTEAQFPALGREYRGCTEIPTTGDLSLALTPLALSAGSSLQLAPIP